MIHVKRLIGLTGKARSGKDTTAYILEQEHRFARHSFAFSLKQACKNIFGLSESQVNGALKEEYDSYWEKSPRQIMQLVGTECLRVNFGETIWLQSLEKRVNLNPEQEFVVVSDVRFDNEAKWIRENGGVVWEIRRQDITEVSPHSSELGVDHSLIDSVIHNDSGLDSLMTKVKSEYELSFGEVLSADT